MSKSILIMFVAALVALGAGPTLGDDGREFVGFAGPVVNGKAGLFEMHALCDAAFAGSRMCKSQDIVDNGAKDDPPPPGQGWVNARIVIRDGTTGEVVDVSGFIANQSAGKLTCSGWQSDSSAVFGLTIFIDAGLIPPEPNFFSTRCDFLKSVACCATRKGKQ